MQRCISPPLLESPTCLEIMSMMFLLKFRPRMSIRGVFQQRSKILYSCPSDVRHVVDPSVARALPGIQVRRASFIRA